VAQRKTAEHATRFTVSLPSALMQTLDRLRSGRAYSNRSEFVRDLLRAELVKEEWQEQTGAALHVHLDAHTCLEVIPLRGAAKRIRQIANRLLSIKGVRYGQLVPATGRRLR
jgi:CopG family nickel-responsive transcriptional regulator